MWRLGRQGVRGEVGGGREGGEEEGRGERRGGGGGGEEERGWGPQGADQSSTSGSATINLVNFFTCWKPLLKTATGVNIAGYY